MPGLVSVPVTVPRADVRGGAIARIGLAGSVGGRKPLKMTRSNCSGPVERRPVVARRGSTARCRAGSDSAVSRYGSPSPTRRTLALLLGRDDRPTPGRRPPSGSGAAVARARRRRAGAPRSPTPGGRGSSMSSIETSVRRCGSSVSVRESRSCAVGEHLDLALDQLEAEVGDRDERAVRQAARLRSGRRARRSPGCSASRPTCRTRTGASDGAASGGVASAASVATRISASPERAASADARRSASREVADVGGRRRCPRSPA